MSAIRWRAYAILSTHICVCWAIGVFVYDSGNSFVYVVYILCGQVVKSYDQPYSIIFSYLRELCSLASNQHNCCLSSSSFGQLVLQCSPTDEFNNTCSGSQAKRKANGDLDKKEKKKTFAYLTGSTRGSTALNWTLWLCIL